MRLAAAVIVALAAVSAPAAAGQGVPATLEYYTGAGQQTGPPSGGSCGYGVLDATSWPYGAIASISSQNPVVASLGSGGCGACLQISCTSPGLCATKQSPVVLVVDSFLNSSLSVPPTLFTDIAPIQSGNAAVLLQQVPCQPTDNIAIKILELRPTAGGYLKVVFLNVAGGGALSTVAVRQYGTGGPFLAMLNTYGAVWEASALPTFPLDLQLVSGGQTIVVQGAISATSTGTIPTIYQFPLGPSGAPALAPSAPLAVQPAAPLSPLPPTIAPPPLAPLPPALAPTLGPISTPGAASPAAATNTTLPSTTGAAGGPAQAPLGTGPGGCSTVLAVLESQPSLSQWVQLLLANGDAPALLNTALKLTMFAPANAAFQTPLTSTPQTPAQLLAANSNVQSPLIGYAIVGGYYPASALTAGLTLTTTDYVQASASMREPLTLTVQAGGVLQGIGSSARILTPDLQACGGPSVVHIIDTVLLPFNASAAAGL